jgi:phospholipid-transporting ATPase
MINGLKDFLEDWKRKKSDDEENKRKCLIYNKSKAIYEEKSWQEIKLGDIVKIRENEFIPADMVIINTSEPNGICYIETKNLDGETNLKFKQSSAEIIRHVSIPSETTDLLKFSGRIDCKPPNEYIYEFSGLFQCDIDNDEISIDKISFLLRGCSLKQTSFVLGFVVYVGHSTKIMKNSPNARLKVSRVESIMSFQIVVILIMQICLSILGSILYNVWYYKDLDEIYYIFPKAQGVNKFGSFIYRTGTWILIFTNLVPISLLVTMETIKFIQGIFIGWDINLYDKINKTPAKVQTSTLNEELGQVKYIFTDKTGTLTKNYMDFKKMSIGKEQYGNDSQTFTEEDLKFIIDNNITNYHMKDTEFERIIYRDGFANENFRNIQLYLTALATCHTVITDAKQRDKIIYQSSSPDEMALVNCARFYKYIFSGRDINNNMFLDIAGKQETFQLLNILEYSSER